MLSHKMCGYVMVFKNFVRIVMDVMIIFLVKNGRRDKSVDTIFDVFIVAIDQSWRRSSDNFQPLGIMKPKLFRFNTFFP